jgi:REP element-mobilizing transposase RayT
MPTRLKRYYGGEHLHFITGSCYHGRPLLGIAERRDFFLRLLEEVRQRHRFVVFGYVLIPEHFHLLIGEPEQGDPSVMIKVPQAGVRALRATRFIRRDCLAAGRGESHLAETVL